MPLNMVCTTKHGDSNWAELATPTVSAICSPFTYRLNLGGVVPNACILTRFLAGGRQDCVAWDPARLRALVVRDFDGSVQSKPCRETLEGDSDRLLIQACKRV